MKLNVGFMTVDMSASNEVVAHSKTFLNLTNDGMATKQFGGDDVLEVVFAEEVPKDGIKIGDSLLFGEETRIEIKKTGEAPIELKFQVNASSLS